MLFRNTLAQSAGTFSAYAVSLILAPLMLSRLGLEAFGVWAVTGALANYAGLLDFGVTRSLSRFVAVYDAEGDEHGIRECLGLGLVVVGTVVAVSAVVALFAAPLVADSLDVLGEDDMRVVLLCSVALFGWQSLRGVVKAIPVGLRQMVPPNVAAVFGNLVNLVVSVVVLIVSPNLVDFAIASALAGAGGFVATVVSMWVVWRPHVAWPSRDRARAIFSFSMKGQVHWLADMVNFQSGKLLLAFAVDVRAAATFEIAARIVGMVKAMALMSSSAMVPTSAALFAAKGGEAVRAFFLRYTPLTLALALPLFVVTALTAPFMLHAWLGEVPPDTIWVTIGLALAYMPLLVIEVGVVTAIGRGDAGLVARNVAVMAALNVVLTVVLGLLLGIGGAVAAAAVAVAAGSALFLRRYARAYGVSLRALGRAVRAPLAAPLGLGLLMAPLAALGAGVADERLSAFAWLLGVGGPYLFAYWILASRLGLLPERLTVPGERPSRRHRRAARERHEGVYDTSST